MHAKYVHLVRVIVLLLSCVIGTLSNTNGEYNVGVGIADCTGPSADIGMMGYANLEQSARGIHTRLFSRAFIFQSGNGPLAVFVSADIGMVDQGLKYMVVKKLQKKYGPDLFTPKNVLLSATHTHSGPGGYMQYLLYGITTLGFSQTSFDAIVDGMVESIERAHANLQPGKVFINKGRVEDANINRSPTAYDANPKEWTKPYGEDNVDKDMVLLRIEGENGKPLGSINWFAVHPTSMNNTNRLISGDNKGYASMQFEYKMNPKARPGKGKFVAAFASSNLGDVSPNIEGARCRDSGEEEDPPCQPDNTCCKKVLFVDTCTNTKCIAYGPGEDMEESTKIIGERQYVEALRLFEDKGNTSEQLKGPVGFVHQYVDMGNYSVKVNYTGDMLKRSTCKAALGHSFAAGTTDGPGLFAFKQGVTTGNPFWDTVSKLMSLDPTPKTADCHGPKPILLPVGELNLPYEWAASIVETQILRVGNLYIVGIPGEPTTMAGRRLRDKITKVIRKKEPGGHEPHVVIAGLSNVYTHYVTTYYEYQVQRYEGASTLYGPYTLDAYLKQYSLLTKSLLSGKKLSDGPSPPNLLPKQLSLIPPIDVDLTPLFKTFGDVLVEPDPDVKPGETVTAHFVGGHPRNDPMRGGTFLAIEKFVRRQDRRWKTIATDADWSTKFRWNRPNFLSKVSVIEISWKVPDTTKAGFYRIRHFGKCRPLLAAMRSYNGTSAVFRVHKNGARDNSTHPDWDPNRKKSTEINSPADFWRALTSTAKN